jgi:CheY-like chemotaxis protein
MNIQTSIYAHLPAASRVTVIDDDEDGCEEISDHLRDFGFEPSAVTGRFDDRLAEMVDAIEATNPSFVICDNRLQPRQMANFYGVSVVKTLVERRQPAMLLTTYASPDRVSLRASRFDVPVIVDRGAFSPEHLSDYFEICRREIVANPVDHRRPRRSLIRIDGVSIDQLPVLDVVVPTWRPDHAVSIPISCVAPELHGALKPGVYLLGEVNIGASDEDELYFHNLNKIAPEPSEALA